MKVIITGATGMVGEGVLLECLSNPNISEILSVSRKSNDISHPKLKEYIVRDFLCLVHNDENLMGYDACFYCAGVSSLGKDEAQYTKLTYDTTLNFAKALSPMNGMTFNYISGSGTDSSEKGKTMWARVKGKTENDLQKLPFKQAFVYRPGLIRFADKQIRIKTSYKMMNFLYPFVRTVSPNLAGTVAELARAMIFASLYGYEKKVLEVTDIRILSKKYL